MANEERQFSSSTYFLEKDLLPVTFKVSLIWTWLIFSRVHDLLWILVHLGITIAIMMARQSRLGGTLEYLGGLDCLFSSFSFLRTLAPLSIITTCVSNPCLVSFFFYSHTLIINVVISYCLQVNLKYEDDALVDREEKWSENNLCCWTCK